MESNRELLLKGNITSLLFKFSAPATIGMVVGALYNIVDTIFVGRGVGSLAIAALSIALPIQLMIMAIGLMVGVGSASIISRALGKNRKDIARTVFGNGVILTLMIGIFCMILGYIFLDKTIIFFGASSQVLPFARDYTRIILIGFIFFSFSFGSSNYIRAEGNPRAAMYVMTIGALVNIILDPIFIFGLKMGIRGAALATVIAQVISCIYLVFYFYFGKSIFRPNTSIFKLKPDIIKEILSIGFPSFLRTTVAGLIVVIFNRLLLFYGSDLYIAIMGIGLRILSFIQMPIVGITQGFSTIVGFNYGAKQYDRVKKVLGVATLWTVIIAGIGFLFMMISPRWVIRLFSDDAGLIKAGISILRIVVIFLPFIGIQLLGGGFFQAIGKARPALILTISRQVIFLIPAVLLLPVFLGLIGIWIAIPVSDFLSIVVTAIWVSLEIKNFNRPTLRSA